MTNPHKSDAAEALANTIVGTLISWALTVFALGYSTHAGLAVTAMFTASSFARNWAIRRIFRRMG